ncbi:conjugal transfer protein TraM [Sphingomonas sp. PAMC 26605]|uniref:conjugal transfer protein TraM n=1 Tax=Sphingomonas sp. PAMC 26605 TaxID=1112214 RepID=UPI00026CB1B7|nr:conjugal transfer protein TraM [Sphingomonas sp. PAMC 26605]
MADHARIRALIAEIAGTHGVALSPDDPLMILQTINTMLLTESADAHQAQLEAFKSELEEMANRWSVTINEKAESILNAALVAAEAAMKQRMAEGAKTLVAEMAAEVSKGRGKPLEDGVRIANRNLIASGLTIAAAIVALVAVLIH